MKYTYILDPANGHREFYIFISEYSPSGFSWGIKDLSAQVTIIVGALAVLAMFSSCSLSSLLLFTCTYTLSHPHSTENTYNVIKTSYLLFLLK